MNAIGAADGVGTAIGRADRAVTFDEFYALTKPRMLRLAVALVSSRSLAEDIVQDAFASSYARFASLEQPEAYVRRSVVNRAYGVFRRRGVARSKETILLDAPHHPEYDTLLALVDRLPARQRAALHITREPACEPRGRAVAWCNCT